jgi:hypothetical protein
MRMTTARMTTVITLRCYSPRTGLRKSVQRYPGNTWVAPGLTRCRPNRTRLHRGYAGSCAGNAWVTPKVTPLLHEGRTLFVPWSYPSHTRVTPGLHPATPWLLPGRTPVTPNLCSDHARVMDKLPSGHTCTATAATKVTPRLHQKSCPKSHPSCTQVTPGLHRGYAKVTHKIRPDGTPVTPWIYLGHTPGYNPVAPG